MQANLIAENNNDFVVAKFNIRMRIVVYLYMSARLGEHTQACCAVNVNSEQL